ncbi:MAG: HlyD family efflux transporter periplasmic adaptor subunit [Candidatus Methylomirabilis oxygeniifera]|uniref:Secretion protein HlyD n=1 Tax=Methylomirabilis oxygeniifera TaxID=671143 RepID=D5MHF1_METO1|nr:MAG: HlyD family efflux transporter periplasmic adaptor subunit [Candidatus Methylomirabilis oxyfera]CBE69183.1 Secretion protein HlyD precursor [Candidatus Methylomirabilis oxyfera]
MADQKRKIALLVALALAGAALFVGWGLVREKGGGDVLVANGTIEATEVEVSSKLPGRLAQLLVKEGDQVQANQVIARLDTSEIEAEVTQAQAALAMAGAQLKELLAGSRLQEIEEARANLQQAEDNLKLAKDEWDRFDNLFKEGAISAQERDQAKNKVEVASSQVRATRERYELVRVGPRPETIEAARHERDRAKATLGMAQVRLRDSTILAPLTAIVLTKRAEQGEVVNPGFPIVILIDPDDLWLRVYIPESEIGLVSIGQEASVAVDSFPNRRFEGKVVEISSKAEFTPRTVQTKKERVNLVFGVKIRLNNHERLLKSGMPADAEIKTGGEGSQRTGRLPSADWSRLNG